MDELMMLCLNLIQMQNETSSLICTYVQIELEHCLCNKNFNWDEL